MKNRTAAVLAVVFYLLLYAISIAHLASSPHFNAGESLAVFLIFGVGFSVLGWLATIGVKPVEMEVQKPNAEFAGVLIYLALFAIVVLGWGLSSVKQAVPDDPQQIILVTLLKVVTMVIFPAILLHFFGYSFREMFAIRMLGKAGWRAAILMTILLFLLQAILGRGLKTLSELDVPLSLILVMAPVALIWFCIEAGLTEEFLFRLFLQTRASAWFRSEVAGILVMALLFGLAHAPGYVLRGQHLMEGMQTKPDVWTAAAYSIAVVSPVGLMFGVLWKRTRNLWLLVFLHGWTDLLPNLARFIKSWMS